MKKILISTLVIVVILGYFFIFKKTAAVVRWDDACEKELTVKGKKIEVCVADTKDTRTQGLSNTSKLSKGKGMLFVFDKVGKYTFWMKDMNYAIDILWLDENMNEVFRTSNALPSDFPATYVSEIPAKYILEVNPGEIPE